MESLLYRPGGVVQRIDHRGERLALRRFTEPAIGRSCLCSIETAVSKTGPE
jgi:hypothetical protein